MEPFVFLNEEQVRELRSRFGTPVFVYDQASLEARAREAIEPPRQPERLPDPDQGRDEPDQGPGPDDEDDFPF